MRVKIKVGGVEQELEFDAIIAKDSSEYAALRGSDKYDASTGTGLVQAGDTSVVFVKDEGTGIIFPVVCERDKDARMAIDITVKDGNYSFKTALNQKKGKSPSLLSGDIDAVASAALVDAKTKFDAKYVVAAGADAAQIAAVEENVKNLQRLYKNYALAPRVMAEPRPDGKPTYQSFIVDFIPVKNGTDDATIIIAPTRKDDGTFEKGKSVYYVPSRVERASCLVDADNFDSLGAVALSSITLDGADPKKFEAKLADGTDLAGLEYLGSATSIVEDLNGFESEFGTDYTNGSRGYVPPAPPAPTKQPLISGGINVHSVKKVERVNVDIPGCLLVGPHAENESNRALYYVKGKTVEEFAAMGLSDEEFLAFVTGRDAGDGAKKVTYAQTKVKVTDPSTGKEKERDKVTLTTAGATLREIFLDEVSVVGVKNYVSYTNKAGQLLARPIVHKSRPIGIWSGGPTLFVDGAVERDIFGGLVASSDAVDTSEKLQKKINKISNGGLDENRGLGVSTHRSKAWLAAKVVLKRVVVSVLAAGVLVGSIVGGVIGHNDSKDAKAKAAAALTAAQQTAVVNTINGFENEDHLRELASLKMPDETQAAIDAGKTAANEDAKNLVIVGGKNDRWFSTIDSYLIHAYEDAHAVHTQQDGTKYKVTVLDEYEVVTDEEGNVSYVYKDKDGNVVDTLASEKEVIEKGFTKVEIDKNAVGKGDGKETHYVKFQDGKALVREIYRQIENLPDYSEAYRTAYLYQAGFNIAKAAHEAGMPFVKIENGERSSIYIYGDKDGDKDCTKEQLVNRLMEAYEIDADMAESFVRSIEDGHDAYVKSAKLENSAVSSGVIKVEDILQSEAVSEIAAKIAGEGAIVLSLSEDGKYAYIQSEDKSVLAKVEILGDGQIENFAQNLQASVDAAKANPKANIIERFGYAPEVLASAYPGVDLTKHYADTYVKLNKVTVNGVTAAQVEICELLAGGKVYDYWGNVVISAEGRGTATDEIKLGLNINGTVKNPDRYIVKANPEGEQKDLKDAAKDVADGKVSAVSNIK